MRKPIIAGNWKMNKTPEEAKNLVTELGPLVKDAKCEVVVCVPFVDLVETKKALRGTKIKLGAQNVHWAEYGAFTGEISATMLKELKVDYVIIGHSERRQYFGETDQTVNAKIKAALSKDLKVIVCVGETLEQYEAEETITVVSKQTIEAFKDISKDELKKIVIAYEPIWAIGTGKTASPTDAEETISVIRKTIKRLYNTAASEAIRIQYGGSMNPKNASELMAMPSIDGGLIGGASLNAQDFAKVVNY
ncbi:MAG: triose-phosphate isomerase [Christensenellaceae bacterium]|jgi:triosephosphate isomerase|nr:triose-phosphate isomerase [Christensenellaceae bacterium]